MAKCDKCNKKAEFFLPYGPHNFCEAHFERFFEKRVRKTIRVNQLIPYGEKIVVALSGGKDSVVCLSLIEKIYGKSNEIEALIVDEGIKGYRDKAAQKAVKYCEKLGVPFRVVLFCEKAGIEMDEVMKKIKKDPALGSTCAYCGVIRREILNREAKGMNADKIATGHNLDDEVQSIAMCLCNNELARLARLGETAGIKKHKEFVPRIKPLYDTPEAEIIAYAKLKKIPYYKGKRCPYAWMAKRNSYRKMLDLLEEESPGTKYSLLASFRELKPVLAEKERKKGKAMECAECGSVSNGKLCSACKMLAKLGAKKLIPEESQY